MKTVFKSEPSNWHARPSSAKKYDYDTLYEQNEGKYEVKRKSIQGLSSSNKWKHVSSKIKYLLDEDKATY
jgi:hypothetical protein